MKNWIELTIPTRQKRKNLSKVLGLIALLLQACTAPSPTDETEREQSSLEPQLYKEQHRPQFHYSPPENWMNDPNGMVYYDGVYHLFYQYYPDSTVWGPMHWGHAVSRDLVHWENLPIALYPDELGYIFSGSAVVDWNSTAGFGHEALVAIFTYHDPKGEKEGRVDYQTQGIAYSLDKGANWIKYEGNPVLKNPGIKDFRDPKVSWHAATKQWVMILAVLDHISIYTSSDLKKWTHASDFGSDQGTHGGVWECPDLFQLNVRGTDQKKWVMLLNLNPGGPHGGSGVMYFIGDFDGKTFTNDNAPEMVLWLDHGTDNYAGVTWSDVPDSDGRRLFIGWMSNWQYANRVPTERWRSAMTVPRTLDLVETPRGLRVANRPVKEMEMIRQQVAELESRIIKNQVELSSEIPFPVSLSELNLEFENLTGAEDFGVALSNTMGERLLIGFDVSANSYYVDRTASGKKDFESGFSGKHTAPRVLNQEIISMRILVDVASIELFADDGTSVMTEIFFPTENYSHFSLYSKGGEVNLKLGMVYQLEPIW